MITGGVGYEIATWILQTEPKVPSGSSQTPAVIAILLAAISGFATLFSIWRQNRNDKVANTAVHSTAANEASAQSFKQVMELNKVLQDRNDLLTAQRDRLEERVEELEGEKIGLERDLKRERRESDRLRTLVNKTGGTP